jgi:CRP-like cAMP-binding protein
VLLEEREGSAGEEEADYQKILASVDILKPLSSQERQEVARSLVRRAYAPGELAVRRGDAGDSMFLIHRGRVEILVPDASGQPKQVAVLGAGNIFGEMSLFTGEARTADVRALEELDLLVIQKPAVERLLMENDKLAQAFSVTIAERQARLTEISRAVPEEEKRMQSETILQRIQRFFSLK